MKIYVTSNTNKLNILANNNLDNVKFYTFSSFLSSYLGSASDICVLDVLDKFNISPSYFFLIKPLLSFIDVNTSYNSFNLEFFKSIKLYLIKNNYYERDLFLVNSLRNFELIFYDIPFSKEFLYLKEVLKKDNVKFLEISLKSSKNNLSSLVFDDPFSEMDYVFSLISNLKNTTSLNNIYLSIPTNYLYHIDFYIKSYNIPINLYNVNLLSVPSVKKFLCSLEIESISNIDIKNKVISLINRYNIKLDHVCSKELLEYLLSNTYLDNKRYLEEVNVFSFDQGLNDDCYLFVLGANSSYPSFNFSFSFLSSFELAELGFISLEEENSMLYDYVLNKFKNLSDVTFSYSTNTFSVNTLSSSLLSELGVVSNRVDRNYGISKLADDFYFANMLDLYYKYNVKSPDLLAYDLSSLPYNTYSYKYTHFKPVINDLRLSFSALKDYIECSFKYYLKYVLKLDEFYESLAQTIGTYAHSVLENDIKGLSVDLKKDFTNKEIYYSNRMDLLLEELLLFNKNLFNAFDFTSNLSEERIVLDFKDFIFKGLIDRVMYREYDDSVDLIIIDYKTGSNLVKGKEFITFNNLQLIFYLYLIKNSNLFEGKKINVLGLYLQKLDVTKLKNLDDLQSSFKLNGYTNYLRFTDPSYLSDFVLNFKLTKKGTPNAYSLLVDDDTLAEALSYCNNLITDLGSNIIEGKFDINPKKIDDIDSCAFCPFKAICFVLDKDIKRR